MYQIYFQFLVYLIQIQIHIFFNRIPNYCIPYRIIFRCIWLTRLDILLLLEFELLNDPCIELLDVAKLLAEELLDKLFDELDNVLQLLQLLQIELSNGPFDVKELLV